MEKEEGLEIENKEKEEVKKEEENEGKYKLFKQLDKKEGEQLKSLDDMLKDPKEKVQPLEEKIKEEEPKPNVEEEEKKDNNNDKPKEDAPKIEPVEEQQSIPLTEKTNSNVNPSSLSKDEKHRIVMEELHLLLNKITAGKTEGNNYFKSGNFESAESTYKSIMKEIELFMPSHEISEPSEEISILLGEVNNYYIQLNGNLSMAYAKQKKFNEGIEICLKIITQMDENNEKAYTRLISWLIETSQIMRANTYAKEAKAKFPDWKNKKDFKSIIDQLDLINSKNEPKEEEQKKNILSNKKGKKETSWWLPTAVGGAVLVAGGLLFSLIYKHGAKFIKK